MDQKALINVVTKSFGLYLILLAFLAAKQLLTYTGWAQFYGDHQADTYFYLGQIIFDLVFDLILAWLFISKSDFISSKLANKSNERVELNATKSDLIELVIIAVGTLTIVNAIPEILNKLTQYIYFNEYGRQDKDLYWKDSNRKTDIVFSGFKFAIGLVAITNGRLIAKRLTRIGDKDERAAK